MKGPLLIIGASGQLGRRVAQQALEQGWRVHGVYHSHPISDLPLHWRQLDISDRRAVLRLVDEVEPQAIVQAAALQGGPHFWRVNADGAAHVAFAAMIAGVRLVHLSSDAIFDGKQAPYTEAHDPSPLTPYGASKAAAETAVRALVPSAAIVRTSLIIDDDPLDKHSRMILDIAAGRRPEALFTDEIRCPVVCADLAAAVLELVELPYSGILNIAGGEALSRHALGMLVARRHGVDPERLRSSTIKASGLQRPADVRLDCSRAHTLLRTRLRAISEFLG